MKSPIIFRVFKNNQLKEVKQFDLDQIVIGHDADVQLDLDDDAVSPIHCLIELRDTGYYICDLGSTSGTFKNGNVVLDEGIQSGDEISIGPFKLLFFVGVPKPKANPPSGSSVIAIPKVAPVVPNSKPATPIKSGPLSTETSTKGKDSHDGKKFTIQKPEIKSSSKVHASTRKKKKTSSFNAAKSAR